MHASTRPLLFKILFGTQLIRSHQDLTRPAIAILLQRFFVSFAAVNHRWGDIARHLPRRAPNTIKNRFWAALRAKADLRRTFLWVYSRLAGSEPNPAGFQQARQQWSALVAGGTGTDLPPLSSFWRPAAV